MARAAVKWSTAKLAEVAGVGLNTVNRFEAGADAHLSSVEKMRSALEAAGVEFTNGGQPGVRILFVIAACSKCGLRAKVAEMIDLTIDAPSLCTQNAEPSKCSNLRKEISAAYQILRRIAPTETMAEVAPRTKPPKRKASEMAGEQIDKLGDSSATSEERQTRKRRLLKGPPEFRDLRVDHPKPKGTTRKGPRK
jgi:transcriptional regulator with XRE-family HTH domain